ncbi:HET-domain-containing protein, partial [Zopfia rhizophila CBS 207.26]
GRPICHELGSPNALELARTWVTGYIQGDHRSCPPVKDPKLPSRVLRVIQDKGRDSDVVCLHLASPDKEGHYVALSYCWGRQQSFTLTTANFESMRRSMELKELPQTIQDAIHVTRMLGFEYIWVDSLCIIQDSESDKADQVSKMQDIFRNSTMTISAERAADSQNG